MKYMKQGSGTDYEMKKGPEKTKKAPSPGWISYMGLDEGLLKSAEKKLAPSQKQLLKIAKAESVVIANQVKSLQQDISNQDIQGIRSSTGTIKFSVDRILKSIH